MSAPLPPPIPDLEIAPAKASAAPAPAPQRTEASGAHLGAIVSAGDFFPDLPPAKTEQFERGSAIETSDRAPLLIDVTPLSLRVETVGGYADVLIQANTPVPCEKTRAFLTASDGQTMVFIRVAQGESSRFAENTYLGELELSGLKPARRGEVSIVVTFELDADGLLNVKARDKETGHETKATMKVTGGSTDATEVAEMQARQARHVVA
jgi:molecular chaperone DnaK